MMAPNTMNPRAEEDTPLNATIPSGETNRTRASKQEMCHRFRTLAAHTFLLL
jgi:hypothetical protein